MSTELKTVKSEHSNSVNVTQHSGGRDRGVIVSLSQKNHHYDSDRMHFDTLFQSVEFDKDQAVAVVAALTEWLANGAKNAEGHS